MWHREKVTALMSALKMIDRRVDPEALIRTARDMGIALPIETRHVHAPSLGGTCWAHRIEHHRLGELKAAVDRIIAALSKRAA